MKCSDCQAQIFERELDHGALAHLTGCEECRALDHEVRLNTEALASMREEIIPARRVRRWPGVVAAIAAALIAAVAVSYEPIRVPEPPVPMAAVLPQNPPPVAEPVLPVAPRPAKKVAVARRKPPATAQPVEEPLLVKFLTDDPDVVIYWLIDPKQGEQVL